MIDRILIDETYGKYEIIDDNGDGIDYGNAFVNLKRVNIFVGANNSGKSRMMRKLFSNNRIQFLLRDSLKIEALERIAIIQKKFADIEKKYHIALMPPRFEGYKERIGAVISSKWTKIDSGMLENSTSISLKEIKNYYNAIIHKISSLGLSFEVRKGIEVEVDQFNQYFNVEIDFNSKDTILLGRRYIPILRGLRPFGGPNHYVDRTLRDYFNNNQAFSGQIKSGLEIYREVEKMHNSLKKDRNVLKEYVNFLQQNFFSEFNVEITPVHEKDVVYVGIGEQEHPIFDLGDGIQSIIALTFPLFAIPKDQNTLVFIEEPELSLHPGMQRIFMETLLDERFSHLQFFITTHSNHLLDLSIESEDVSVYTFKKKLKEEPEFVVENVYHGNTTILDLLGVKSSSVFLSNSTIWVEGITDRKYLKFYLKAYFQAQNIHNLREDVEYTFMEYGGSNITHFDFGEGGSDEIIVGSVSNKFMVIVDHDGAEKGSAKHARHEKLFKALGNRLELLKVREIENLLPPSIIHQICKMDEDLNYTIENYEAERMGDFIFKKYPKSTFKQEGKTVNNKLNFCNKAIEAMTEKFAKFKDNMLTKETVIENGIMSEKAWELTERIVEFIKKSNQL